MKRAFLAMNIVYFFAVFMFFSGISCKDSTPEENQPATNLPNEDLEENVEDLSNLPNEDLRPNFMDSSNTPNEDLKSEVDDPIVDPEIVEGEENEKKPPKKIEVPKKPKKERIGPLDLYWLRDHQNDDGSWSTKDYLLRCGKPSRSGKVIFNREGKCSSKNEDDSVKSFSDEAVTGLAIMAYLAAGYTHEDGELKLTVKKGIRYLMGIIDDEGCIGTKDDENQIFQQAVCSIALSESRAMTGAAKLKKPAQKAVDYLAKSQIKDENKNYLAWGTTSNSTECNPLISGWVMLALKSARAAGLNIPQRCWDGLVKYFKSITTIVDGCPRTKVSNNYRFYDCTGFDELPILDAINVLLAIYVGTPRTDEAIQKQAKILIQKENLPSVDNPKKIDFMYWYFATNALYQMGGDYWKAWQNKTSDDYWRVWESKILDVVYSFKRFDESEKDKCVYGSYEPIDAWGKAGGRVYATAINSLILQIHN